MLGLYTTSPMASAFVIKKPERGVQANTPVTRLHKFYQNRGKKSTALVTALLVPRLDTLLFIITHVARIVFHSSCFAC